MNADKTLILLFSVVAFGQTPLRDVAAWSASNPNAYSTAVVNEGCPSGRCLVLSSKATVYMLGAEGTITQLFDAGAYRATKIRFRALVRAEVSGPLSQAQLRVRVERRSGATGFSDDMSDRPITSAKWQAYEITGDIDSDAAGITVGLTLAGAGKVWIDSPSFEMIGDATPLAPPRGLTARGVDNLEALARLYGFVRFFHPSDEAAAADWNALLRDAVIRVEPAESAEELCARLRAVFGPVAPSVQIYAAGSPAPRFEITPSTYAIRWEHHGLGFLPEGGYRSRRVVAPATDVPAPFRASLAGGVSVVVPTTLYRDSPEAPAPSNFLTRQSGSGDDRTTRLVAAIVAWNVLQHFYPYFDVVPVDWSAVLRTTLLAAATDHDGDAFEKTLRLMIAALHDGHGNVSRPGERSFLPAVEWTWADERIVALAADPATGIRRGDAIVTIDGTPAAQALAQHERLTSGATPQWVRYMAIQSLLAGPRDSTVRLEMEPFAEPGTRRAVTLKRAGSGLPFPSARPEKVKEIAAGIFYVDLSRVKDDDFAAALPLLVAAKGIVFDLRGYPGQIRNPRTFFGHLVDRRATSAQFLIPIFTRPDREGVTFEREDWQIEPLAPHLGAKLVFLTDGRAISTAESYMGVVEGNKIGAIVGGPTAGTNGGINPFVVPGGYTITWTGMKVLKHDGSRHHGVGILPTALVAPTRAGIAAGRDEVLERALELLR